jgi:Na+-driven multidrug efflux pump
LLTSLPSLQQLADRYLIWQIDLPVVGVWCYLLDGMFIGATRGAEMRNSMAVAAAGFALTLLTLPVSVTMAMAGAGGVSRAARPVAGGYLAAPLAARHLVFVAIYM